MTILLTLVIFDKQPLDMSTEISNQAVTIHIDMEFYVKSCQICMSFYVNKAEVVL